MRTGIGDARPHTRRSVARALDRGSRGIARAERRGLRNLRTAARETACGGPVPDGTETAVTAAPAYAAGGQAGGPTGGRPRNREPSGVLGERESHRADLGLDQGGPFGRGAGDPAPSTIGGILFIVLIALFIALVAIAVVRRPQPRAR